MDNERLHVGNVCQQREDLKLVNEGPCFFLATFYLDGKDAAAAIGEELRIELMVGMAGQRRVVDASHFRVIGKELDYLLCVVGMTFNAQAQRLESLQQYPCVEGVDGSSGVAEDDGTDTGDEGGSTATSAKTAPW